MPDLPSRLDLYAIGRSHVLTRAKRIDPKQVDVEGSDANIIVASSSYMAYEVIKQLSQKVGDLLLDGAVAERLDRLVFDRYGRMTRKGAAAAVGTVRFYRTATTAGAGSVPVGTKLLTLTGLEYVTTTQATFAATDVEASCLVRAVAAGKATQAGANTIRRVAQPGTLFDTTLQVNNDVATSGGEDVELDEALRERARDVINSSRRGTLGAIELGARSVPGVESAQAIESLTPLNQPARLVQLFIADSSGVSNEALAASVRAALAEYRAAGIMVLTSTSTPQIVSVQLKLTFRAGVDTATLAEQIRASVVEFINSLGVNQALYRLDMSAVLRRFVSQGLIPTEGTLVLPVGDLVPDLGYTLRTTTSNVLVV